MASRARRRTRAVTRGVASIGIQQADVSLLDVIDHVLNQGVVLSGELILGVADVDLIYVRVLALVSSADRAESAGADLTSFLGARRRG